MSFRPWLSLLAILLILGQGVASRGWASWNPCRSDGSHRHATAASLLLHDGAEGVAGHSHRHGALHSHCDGPLCDHPSAAVEANDTHSAFVADAAQGCTPPDSSNGTDPLNSPDPGNPANPDSPAGPDPAGQLPCSPQVEALQLAQLSAPPASGLPVIPARLADFAPATALSIKSGTFARPLPAGHHSPPPSASYPLIQRC